MRLSRRAALVLCAVIVAMAPIVGWIASTAASGDSAPDNVDLAGKAVGGLRRVDVEATTRDLATQYASVPVSVVAGEVTVS